MPSDSTINKIFGEMSKASAATQITIGVVTGWATGYVFSDIGETIAIAIGGGIILLKVGEQQGYITITNPKSENFVDVSGAAHHWYTNLIGDDQGKHINELHLFIASFCGGVSLGLFKVHEKLLEIVKELK